LAREAPIALCGPLFKAALRAVAACVSVCRSVCPIPAYTLERKVLPFTRDLCFRSSASQISLDGPRPITSLLSPDHDRRVELRCRGIISVEQSSCCSTETIDDNAHFQETTESLSVPHLVCWRTEGTCTTARRCCGVFVILASDTKLQTY